MESLFVCPLCASPLERVEKRYLCPRGHSFDLAREGYVNLLPPNRRHSREPGDDKLMVAARTRFLEGGWYGPLRESLSALAAPSIRPGAAFLDAGCGEGWYTEPLSRAFLAGGGRAAGVDLSRTAVRRAARRCPGAETAVASVYRLPLADASTDLLLCCFSPLAAEEFRRVLRPGGRFLYAVPGPRHLWEMKELLYPEPYENEDKLLPIPGFSPPEVHPTETRFTLTDPEDILALFGMTPYAWKTPKEGMARLRETEALTVTAQFRIHEYVHL